MKKTFLILMMICLIVIAIIMTLVLKDESDAAEFRDAEYDVSFAYPLEWEARARDMSTLFAANFDYFDGISSSSASQEAQGMITYTVMEDAPTTVEALQEESDAAYKECLAEFEESADGWGPFCFETDYTEWNRQTIDGYTALVLDWEGVPASGEMVKRMIILVDDKELMVTISAIKTGVTDEEVIEAVWEQVIDTLEVK